MATLFLAAGMLFFSAGLKAQANPAPSLPAFEFHSGFWVNLHHFLYLQGRLRRAAGEPSSASEAPFGPATSLEGLTAAEQSAWNGAVAAYAADWSSYDLLNNNLELINNRLAELEDCRGPLQEKGPPVCISGLRPKMVAALNQAAPVYRAHWWPQHDRENRAWIAAVAPLVRQMGEVVGDQLTAVYQRRWPAGLLRVDVSWYAGSQGGYTSLQPLHITLSSHDPRNQGFAAFEMVFHEASYALAAPVNDAIAAECRKLGIPIPRELWSALVFYTTGEMVRRALASRPAGSTMGSYTPYAYRNGLFDHGWSEYQQVLVRYWQPYLDGELGFDTAISRMIASL